MKRVLALGIVAVLLFGASMSEAKSGKKAKPAPADADRFNADTKNYTIEEGNAAKAARDRDAVLNAFTKTIVFHSLPTQGELYSVASIPRTSAIIDTGEPSPKESLYQRAKGIRNLEMKVVLSGAMKESDANKVLLSDGLALVLDLRTAQDISEDFLMMQSDYFPFTPKVVRLPLSLLNQENITKLKYLRSYSLELELDRPLTPAQRKMIDKFYKTVFKHFIVTSADAKLLASIKGLGNMIVSFDMRQVQNPSTLVSTINTALPKVDKGVVVEGPFSPQQTRYLGGIKNLKLMTIHMKSELDDQFRQFLSSR